MTSRISYRPSYPPVEDVLLTVFCACYNEEKHVANALSSLKATMDTLKYSYEVIVIDDASTDRTSQVVEDWKRANPDVPLKLVRNAKNRGLATGFVDAAFMGRGKYYTLLCGDDPMPPEAMFELFRHIGKADMILPYPEDLQGKSRFRRAISGSYTKAVSYLSGHKITYYNGCGIHLRYNVMRWGPYSFGFGFQAELVTRLLDEDVSYLEVALPALTHREKGSGGALNVRNVLSVTHTLFEIVVRRVRKRTFGN